MERADAADGPFGDHLKRIVISVSRLSEVGEYVRSVLSGSAVPHREAYYWLISAGILRQHDGTMDFRCELYCRCLARYFVD